MSKQKIFNILFWILLLIGIILIIWKIFGNTPSDLSIIITVSLMLLFKIWSISDDLKDFKYGVKSSFNKVKTEINEFKKKYE